MTLSSQLDFNWESADVKHGSLRDIYSASQVSFDLKPSWENDCREDKLKGKIDFFSLGGVISHDQTMWCSLENYSFIHVKIILSYTRDYLKIWKQEFSRVSSHAHKCMEQQTAQAKKV